jgi:hypothetical protein
MFTRLNYDESAYKDKVNQSSKIMDYQLNPNYTVNCNSCFPNQGPPQKGISYSNSESNNINIGDYIDTESILKGLNRISTKSIEQSKLEPLKPNNKIPSRCSLKLETENSKYINPTRYERGMNTPDMRLDFPLYDPQCHIFEPFAVNTRLQAKDNYVTPWQIPLNESEDFLPKNRKKCKKN